MSRGADYSKLWEELERRLTDLVTRLDGFVSPEAVRWVREFVDHNEFGIAWEAIADDLIAERRPISGEDYAELSELADLMTMSDADAASRLEALRLLRQVE